ncbi:MAG: AI-2E family transporter [Spirochaetales bacterium]|jgi:predicted PurR-regulated permease PerM|nr:AI-2E family transporter [Spirochaetales bacterium]
MQSKSLPQVFLGILAVLAISAVLYLAAGVLIPLVTAILVSFIVSPVISFLHKRLHIPRPIAIFLVLLLVMTVVFLIGLFFYSSVQSFYRELPKYSGKFTEISLRLINRFRLPEDILEEFSWVRSMGSYLMAFSRGFVDFLSGLILMMLFLVFLLFERAHIRPKLWEAFESRTTHRLFVIYAHISRQIGRYLSVKLLVSVATGFLMWLTLWIIGIEFAFVWGVLTFFFNFIPNIGAIILTAFIEVFAVLQFYPSPTEPIVALVVMIVFQQVMGNLVEPALLGERLDLSPVVIIFSLVIWGWIWGILGMFLAVPLIVAIKIVLENIPFLKPAAVLMGTGKRLSSAS